MIFGWSLGRPSSCLIWTMPCSAWNVYAVDPPPRSVALIAGVGLQPAGPDGTGDFLSKLGSAIQVTILPLNDGDDTDALQL